MDLLIEGVFDTFHKDQKKYIKKCIDIFKQENGIYPLGLKVNVMSNVWAHKKGPYRPLFDAHTRKEQVRAFINGFKNIIPKTEVDIANKAAFEYLDGDELRNKYPQYKIALCLDNKPRVKTKHFIFLEVPPINTIHTSDIEKRLSYLKNSSSNKIRKVGAIVIQNGEIIGEGVNAEGDDTCPKCTLFSQGKINEARLANCNHPHAEVIALNELREDFQNTALIVTTAPCGECAKYILEKKVPLVIYLEEYIRVNDNKKDNSGIQMLLESGVEVRKAGI